MEKSEKLPVRVPSRQKWPGGHSFSHEMRPVVSQIAPLGHCLAYVKPKSGAMKPTGAGKQLSWPTYGWYMPGGHIVKL